MEQVIKVIGYSGYKANERPLRFTVNDESLEVEKILDRWAGQKHDYFKVLADNGRTYLLKWQRLSDIWFLVKVMQSNPER